MLEAIEYKARPRLHGSKLSPRRQAFRALKIGEIAVPSRPEVEANSPEALDFIDEIRPLHFASFAQTLSLVFKHVKAMRSRRGPDGLPPLKRPEAAPRDPWCRLVAEMNCTFLRSAALFQRSRPFQTTEEFARLTSSLDTRHRITTREQISSGAVTGASSNLVWLRNMPHNVRHHWPSASVDEIKGIARHPESYRGLERFAKLLSVNQLMAAQSAMVEERTNTPWDHANAVISPRQTVLREHADGSVSLDMKRPSELILPAGFVLHPEIPTTNHAMPVTEVESFRESTVGCPMTLIRGAMAELSLWMADIVERRELWDMSRPPTNPVNL